MINAAVIPFSPSKPIETSTSDDKIKVISVIPDTGFVPTIAIALAATVVNKNAITKTIKSATMVWNQLPKTPNWKNTTVETNTAIITERITFIEISRWVRSTAAPSLFLPPNSLTAKPTACLIMPDCLMIPIKPAIAIPPMPIGRPYAWKSCIALISAASADA